MPVTLPYSCGALQPLRNHNFFLKLFGVRPHVQTVIIHGWAYFQVNIFLKSTWWHNVFTANRIALLGVYDVQALKNEP